MNLWIDSERKWAQEPNQNRKLKESICIIKICPIKWITLRIPMDTNNLRTRGQSVEFYQHKWIPGMIQNGNEL